MPDPYLNATALEQGVLETFVDAADAPRRCGDCHRALRRESYGDGTVLVNAALIRGTWVDAACYERRKARARVEAILMPPPATPEIA